jgi:hypothetical protein
MQDRQHPLTVNQNHKVCLTLPSNQASSTLPTPQTNKPTLREISKYPSLVPMCYDTLRHWRYCGHRQHIYGQYGHHVYNDLRRINDPCYLAQSGIPYRQSNHCHSQTRYEPRLGWCHPCHTGHMTRQGWNFRGYAGGMSGRY